MEAKLDNHLLKIRMPMTIRICPRPSTGRTAFIYHARFDMMRRKSIVSEDIEGYFGLMEVITYPGPIGLTNANGRLIYCSGEVT